MAKILSVKIRTQEGEVLNLNEVECLVFGDFHDPSDKCYRDDNDPNYLYVHAPNGSMRFNLDEIVRLDFKLVSKDSAVILDSLCERSPDDEE